jgi:4'-phosphopantetheinyl transferase EntD
LIEKILPAGVAYAEAFTDPPDITLFPEEEALLARAVDKRRREFATARGCARRALADLGVAPTPILRGERGAPRWPQGIVGSITHCAGYRAAAVAHARDMMTIGLDAEPNEPLPDRVIDVVSLPGERALLRDLESAAPGACLDRLLFCAKETVYKAWFPLTGRWLGFEDADITINAADGTFEARLLIPAPTVGGSPLRGFSGSWLAGDGLILTTIALPVLSGR